MRLSLLVIGGSAIGGLARYWLAILVGEVLGGLFPWGTLLINVLGSLMIGVAGSATDARDHAAFRAFLMVGICGGFTTFSSFSLQTFEMMENGRAVPAFGYITASVALCLLATWAGWQLGKLEWS